MYKRQSLNKHIAVASTSADALWADANSLPNKFIWSSVKVGSLYFLPLPPESLHKDAVSSVQVSILGKSFNGFFPSILKNSEPIIFSSKFKL